MILSLYIARRFLWAFAQVFFVFLAILLLLDTIEQIRRFADQGISTAGALQLATMNTPASLYRILPLITILAAITMFLSLARSSELVVMRAAGRSALRFLVAPVLVALIIGMLAVAVLNPLVAATQKSMTGCGPLRPRAYKAPCPLLKRAFGCVRAMKRAKRSSGPCAPIPMGQSCLASHSCCLARMGCPWRGLRRKVPF